MRKCILALVLVLSVLGCESEAERERERQRQARTRSSASPDDGSVHLTGEQIRANNIQTTAATTDNTAPSITATGRTKARAGAESRVFAPFAGRILISVPPRLGGEVRAGQVLAEVEQIFPASERVQLKATSLQLETDIDHGRQEVDLRQKELDRARELYDGGAIPLKEFQSAEFNVKQAQTKLEGAQRAKAEYDATIEQQSDQRLTPIRAPIAGTIVAMDLVGGQQVDPSKDLMTIVDTNTVWAELAVRESDLPQMRQATAAEIVVPSDPNRVHSGQLVTVGIVVDPQNRTVPVIFAVPNPDRSLKLDMLIEGRVPVGPLRKTVVVPASAVLSEQGISSVFVETEPGVFRRRIITAGQRHGANIAIVSGLEANEKVVSVGAQSLNSETLKTLIPRDEEEGKR
ncbi:MAG TPA: efflux RND transporter periplasmic adaptor subunit [Terriglobia bacterium]|nr:efflux RND transporter periplasmic adaptor subunit [Terriglobia bacterium]